MLILSIVVPILLMPITILVLMFLIDLYDNIYNSIRNYFYIKYKYELTDTIHNKINIYANYSKHIIITLNYKKDIIILNNFNYQTMTILDRCIYLKLTDKNLIKTIIHNLDKRNIYNIKYNGLYEIEKITDLTEFYYKTLNKIFISDITNIIINFLFDNNIIKL
jgi:hypothetical protein